MIQFTWDWGYYYTVMLMCGTMLLISLVSIVIAEITRIIAKTTNKIVNARIWCKQHRDQKILELSNKAAFAESKEERLKVFEEMREYRNTYIVNRRRL